MKYILLVISFFVFSTPLIRAQVTPIQVTFNKEGKVVGPAPTSVGMPSVKKKTIGLFKKSKKNPIFKFPAANTAPLKDYTLSDEQKSSLRKLIAAKFQKAIDNLQDKKLNLEDIYDLIWGSGETKKIIADYKTFLRYLNDPVSPTSYYDNLLLYNYLPKPSYFEDKVFNKRIYAEDADLTGKEYLMRKLIVIDPYKHFVLSRLEVTMRNSGINTQQMDLEYKTAWRELEDIYKEGEKVLAEIKEALKPCSPTVCKSYNDLITRLVNLINNRSNSVQQLLQQDFFKQWLWYNEGYLFMNPVIGTVKEKRYPTDEKISQLTDENKKLILTDSAEDKILAELFTTKRVRNEVLVAMQGNGTTKRKADRFYYDAAKNYECLNEKDLPKARDSKRGVDLVIYNVPLKEKLAFNFDTSKNIPDMGSVAQSIIDAGSGPLSLITSNAADWIKAWGKISESFNKKAATPVFIIQDMPLPGQYANGDASVHLTKINSDKIAADYNVASGNSESLLRDGSSFGIVGSTGNGFFKAPLGVLPSGETLSGFNKLWPVEITRNYLVTIGKRKVAATNNSDTDKVIFTKAFLIQDDDIHCNTCNYWVENCLIDTFLLRDRCYALNYENKPVLQDGVDALLTRFDCYTKLIKQYRTDLKSSFDDINGKYLPVIRAYLNIIQRSLPPVLTNKAADVFKEEEISKDTAEYRTELMGVSRSNLPDGTKKIVYRVISNQPVKQIDGKKAGEQNIVIEHTYRYSNKRHFVDFSVGLSYISKDYMVKSIDGSLPKVSEGNRFRPITGMHIYPAGLLKIDDRLNPRWSRLSVFLGLSLSKSLENLYPAISYDVVPGIRIMGGYHLYKDTRYSIVNNQIIDHASSFRGSGFFFSLNMEPKSFVTFIGLLK